MVRAAPKSLGFVNLPRRCFHSVRLYRNVNLETKLLLWERRPDCTEVLTFGSLGLAL